MVLKKSLWLPLLVGLALRLGWVFYSGTRIIQPDEGYYLRLADTLAKTGNYTIGGWPTAAVPPGWPLLLSFARRFLPNVPLSENLNTSDRMLTAFLGTLLIAVTFLLGQDLFGRRAGLIAAWIAALHPILIYWSGVAMTETLFALFCLLGLLFEIRKVGDGGLNAACSGFFWGVAAVIRMTALPIGVAIGLLSLRKRNLWATLGFFLWFQIFLSSWAIRNYQVFGAPHLDLHSGPWIVTATVYHDEYLKDAGAACRLVTSQAWWKTQTQGMDEAQLDGFCWRIANHWYLTHWRSLPRFFLSNLVQFWRLYPRDVGSNPYNHRWLAWLSILSEGPLFVLCGVGIWRRRRSYASWWPILGFVWMLMCLHGILYAQMRYRLPVTPLMAVFAGGVFT